MDPLTEDESLEPCAGDVLGGKYRLLTPVASGGMGRVWIARNLTTDAEVAAKILLPSSAASPDALARFRREAKATAALSHRAIVRVFDFIEVAPGQGPLVMIMELLRGQTLARRIHHLGALSLEETFQVAFPLLSALSHAHRLGIVHRDLKPENVILALEPDGRRLPKIVDFGISKLLREQPITLDGQIMGTLHYMSPEQTRGEPIDERTDVFSLGVILYECLSGRNPFAPTRPCSVPLDDLLSVLQVEPAPLENVPPPVWRVVARALAKDPDARFASVGALEEALRQAAPSFVPTSDTVTSAICPPILRASRPPPPRTLRLSPRMAAAFVVASLSVVSAVSASAMHRGASNDDHGARSPRAVLVHEKLLTDAPERLRAVAPTAVDPRPPETMTTTSTWASRSPHGGVRAILSGKAPLPKPSRILLASRRAAGILKDPGF